MFGSKATSASFTFQRSAAKRTSRALICRAALAAAMPLRSDPEDAAVADVFGTLPVVVAVTLIRSRFTWNSSATTWATLV
ncbi:hypothetical protein D9M72_540060 [compost metagenome]